MTLTTCASQVSRHQVIANISSGYLDTAPTMHQKDLGATHSQDSATTVKTGRVKPWIVFTCVDALLYLFGLLFMWITNNNWTFTKGVFYSDGQFIYYMSFICAQLICFIPIMLFMVYARNEPEILSRHRFFAVQVITLTFFAILLRILYLVLVFQKLPYRYGTEDYTIITNLLNIIARASIWGILSAVILRLRCSFRVWVCHDLSPKYWPTLLWHSVLFCMSISTAVVNTARPDYGLHKLHMRAGIWIGWALMLVEFTYYIARAYQTKSPYIDVWMYIRIWCVAVMSYALGIFSYYNKTFSCDSFLLTFPVLFYVVWIELFALPVCSVLARYRRWTWMARLDMMNVAHDILTPSDDDTDVDTCVADKIINDPYLFEKFTDRCERGFVTENLVFLTKMHYLRKLRYKNPGEAANVLDDIYQQCIQKGAPNSINICALNRSALIRLRDQDVSTSHIAAASTVEVHNAALSPSASSISAITKTKNPAVRTISGKSCKDNVGSELQDSSVVSIQLALPTPRESPRNGRSRLTNEIYAELLVSQERVLSLLSFHVIEFYKDPEVAQHMARLNQFCRQLSLVSSGNDSDSGEPISHV